MRVAKTWFERREVGDRVSLIWEPHVHPFFRCNIWLVKGRDRDLLIDSGMGLTAGKPVIALATHAHVDHIGSLHEFDDRRAHRDEAAAYATMPDDVTLAPMFREIEAPVDAAPHDHWTPDTYQLTPAPISAELDSGDMIDLGDRRLRVLHLPGHSPGCIGLFEEASGLLFSGDALYDGELLDDLPHSNVAEYGQTMEFLRTLDIRLGHGGHCDSFDNARKLLLIDEYMAGKRVQGCPGTGSTP
jgi:glyoxylase-like metal-dependent hydrolase (beta-lactamase superfamily II)